MTIPPWILYEVTPPHGALPHDDIYLWKVGSSAATLYTHVFNIGLLTK